MSRLSKQYEIGATTGGTASYRSIREDFAGIVTRRRRVAERRMIWALQDVSFEVAPGERVGVIGRNGAGKSTLLKLLSRITAPTRGRAEVRGRIGSLLEVGTGFHPELSGRDNISLAAAILGMRRREVDARLDEIVEFAGVAAFLDTPVKRYSSGMYLRLAFAVAAHLEPEILMVDEVLAVGDADFQRKCLGRMTEIGESGRTVLFVSHSMPSVLRLCDRVILLDQGGVAADGPPREVIRQYLGSGEGSSAERSWSSPDEAPGDGVARLKVVRILQGGQVDEEIDVARPVDLQVEYWLLEHTDLRPFVNLHLANEDGVLLFITSDSTNLAWRTSPRRSGVVTATCRIPAHFLAEGRLFVLAAVSSLNPTTVHAMEADAVSFHVVDRTSGEGARGEWANDLPGVVRPLLPWTIKDSYGEVWTPDLTRIVEER
ncbi:MAG: ABC transporter ATP-binding protein [Acidimicrobiales bacterium]